MGKAKRTLSVIMAALMLVFTCMTYVPANAAEAGAPEIAFVGIDHSPLVVGDTETFSLTTRNADSVQYNVVLKDAKGTVVEDLTKGYTSSTEGTTPYVVKSSYVFALGKYTLSISAKRADGKVATYDAALNCVTRDNANRVYANGAVDGAKDGDVFVKNTPVTIAGVKDLGGIAGPYKYKLHVFNATKGTWTNHVQATYSDNIIWTPSEAGTYVLDIHINTPNSTTWTNYTSNPTGAVYGTYEAWKLVTVKVVDSKYSLVLSTNATNGSLVADGNDHAVVTAKFMNNLTGTLEKVDGLVAFTTTYGNLANTRVALQDGVANVTLTSEFSAKTVTTKLDAQLIEAEAGYKDFINTAAQSIYLSMGPKPAAATDAPQIVGAESNEADSITLFYDKDVTVNTFVDVDEDGEYVIDEDGYAANADGYNGLTITQEPTNRASGYEVLGYKAVPGNSKAIEVILDPMTPLLDNEKVNVKASFTTSNGLRESNTSFVITDARKPELTSAKADGLKTVVLTFSEPIADWTGLQIDGGIIPIATADLGSFDPSDPVKGDTRNQITVNVGSDANGQVYLKGGTHSVQVGSVSDFAALRIGGIIGDPKNISSTQTLDFLVPVDTSVPTATITQESPEQFRLKFNKPVTNFAITDLVMQKYDAEDETTPWKPVLANDYVITPVGTANQEWVIELVRDWTVILNTDVTLENYYTGDYRFFIAKHLTTVANSGVQNPANGKWNTTDMIMTLPGLKTPDVTSPVINDIAEATTANTYTVTMSEPVKLTGLDVPCFDTVSQTQLHGVPSVLVDFIGTDKDGKVVTVHGSVVGYSATNGSDMKFNVVANENLRTVYVDNGGSKNWTLVVKNVTDDVGNAAPTLSKAFVVNPSSVAATKYQVAHNEDGTHKIIATDNDGTWDEISVEFTLPVKFTGTYENALNVANFLLDGENLPKDTLITIDLSSGTPDKGYTRIIITLPQGVIANGEVHTLDISRYLKSASGVDLTGETEFVFLTGLPEGLN